MFRLLKVQTSTAPLNSDGGKSRGPDPTASLLPLRSGAPLGTSVTFSGHNSAARRILRRLICLWKPTRRYLAVLAKSKISSGDVDMFFTEKAEQPPESLGLQKSLDTIGDSGPPFGILQPSTSRFTVLDVSLR